MSTEENDDLTLVHEDYIDEHSIDETTLPQQVRADIEDIDDKIDSYNLLDEDDDEAAEALEREIEGMSRKIKVDIMNYFTSQGSAPAPKKREVEVDGRERKSTNKKEESSKSSISGSDLLDTIFGF
jgi:hypothetical protein